MKAMVDPDLCTGCELCVSTCPEVFEMGDDVAKVIVDVVPGDSEECVKEAADDCPAEAIKVEEQLFKYLKSIDKLGMLEAMMSSSILPAYLNAIAQFIVLFIQTRTQLSCSVITSLFPLLKSKNEFTH